MRFRVLEIVIGLDELRDRNEIERLGLPKLTTDYVDNVLLPKYKTAGFDVLEHGFLDAADWSKLETSWARKLKGSEGRKVWYLVMIAA